MTFLTASKDQHLDTNNFKRSAFKAAEAAASSAVSLPPQRQVQHGNGDLRMSAGARQRQRTARQSRERQPRCEWKRSGPSFASSAACLNNVETVLKPTIRHCAAWHSRVLRS